MKLNEVITQAPKNIRCSNTKCNGEIFSITKQPLNGNGPLIAVVSCKNCGQIMGQLEPNSVTTNLGQIDSMLSRVLPVLERVEAILKSPGTTNNQVAQDIKPQNPTNQSPQNNSAKQGENSQKNQVEANPDDPINS